MLFTWTLIRPSIRSPTKDWTHRLLTVSKITVFIHCKCQGISLYVVRWASACVCHALPYGRNTDYSFCPVAFKLHLYVVDDERSTLLILGQGSKVKVNFGTLCIRPCGHNTDYTCCSPITDIIPLQQPWRGYSNVAARVWLGEWVGTCVCQALLCGRDTDYIFYPINFKLHMWVVDDERRNPFDFGYR